MLARDDFYRLIFCNKEISDLNTASTQPSTFKKSVCNLD